MDVLRLGKTSDPRDLHDLIVQIYRGCAEDSGWLTTLRQLREMFRGESAAVAKYDFAAKKGSILFSDGLNDEYLAAYNDYYYKLNPWLSPRNSLSAGEVLTSEQVLPTRRLVRTEFYNEWLKPQSLFHTIRGGIIKREVEILYVGVGRSKEAGPFEAQELEQYRSLLPHMRWAVSEYLLLNRLRAASRGALAALDVLPFGITILDTSGKSAFTNRAAAEILKEGDGLKLRLTGLQATAPQEQAQLRDLLHQAIEAAGRQSAPFAATMAITRSAPRQPLSISISPLPIGGVVFDCDRPAVVVVIGDSERVAEPDERTLAKLYGLTKTEARLACCLAQGRRVDEAARHLHITPSTARTHLKHIFSKTETSRQAELVKLVLTGPVHIEPGVLQAHRGAARE